MILPCYVALSVALGAAPIGATSIARPPALGKGKAVARIVAGKGYAEVRDVKGRTAAAQTGLPMLSDDTLVVKPGAFAVVELLSNGWLVRIDEDVELLIRDIALFSAPRQTESLTNQLDKLLTPAERQEGVERMIGWHAGVVAANAPSIGTEIDELRPAAKAKRSNALKTVPSDQPVAPGAAPAAAKDVASAPPPASPPPSAQPAPALTPTEANAPARAEAPAPVAEKAGGAAPRSSLDQEKPPAPAAQAAPALREEATKAKQERAANQPGPGAAEGAPAVARPLEWSAAHDPVLSQCLDRELRHLGTKVRARFKRTITLRFRVTDHGVQVQLAGALPTPACVQGWFDQRSSSVTNPNVWNSAMVPLP